MRVGLTQVPFPEKPNTPLIAGIKVVTIVIAFICQYQTIYPGSKIRYFIFEPGLSRKREAMSYQIPTIEIKAENTKTISRV